MRKVEGLQGPSAGCVDEREFAQSKIECSVLGTSNATKYYSCRNLGRKLKFMEWWHTVLER